MLHRSQQVTPSLNKSQTENQISLLSIVSGPFHWILGVRSSTDIPPASARKQLLEQGLGGRDGEA